MSQNSDPIRRAPLPLAILSIAGQILTLFAGLLLVAGAGGFVTNGQTAVGSVLMVLAGSASIFGALAWRTEAGRGLALVGGALLSIAGIALSPFIGIGQNQLLLLGGFGLMVLALFARSDESLF